MQRTDKARDLVSAAGLEDLASTGMKLEGGNRPLSHGPITQNVHSIISFTHLMNKGGGPLWTHYFNMFLLGQFLLCMHFIV